MSTWYKSGFKEREKKFIRVSGKKNKHFQAIKNFLLIKSAYVKDKYRMKKISQFLNSPQVWSRAIFTLLFLRELVVRAGSSIVYGSLQWQIYCFYCQLLLLCYSISLIELTNKLICSSSEGLFFSQITRKILYACTVLSVSHSHISLCHIFQFSIINREASSPPTGKTIAAGIFSKRIHLSHLVIFFIFMSSFWLHPHNSYSIEMHAESNVTKKTVHF